jgi:hypothetical protein
MNRWISFLADQPWYIKASLFVAAVAVAKWLGPIFVTVSWNAYSSRQPGEDDHKRRGGEWD